MNYNIREMIIEDYDQLIQLFEETPGITLREADSYDATERYLKRNHGLSFVAVSGDRIIGCVMCGEDGRRGYLQHLIVIPQFRNNGIGSKLFQECLNGLAKLNIYKTHLFVLRDNVIGNSFWQNRGWKLREDINMYSFVNSSNKNE